MWCDRHFGLGRRVSDPQDHLRRHAGVRGHNGGRKPERTASLIGKAQPMYDARQFTLAEIATSCGVTPMTIYRHIRTEKAPRSLTVGRDAPRSRSSIALTTAWTILGPVIVKTVDTSRNDLDPGSGRGWTVLAVGRPTC